MVEQNSGRGPYRWLLWLARSVGLLACLVWLFIMLGHLFSPTEESSLEGAVLVGLALLAIAGVALSWWREWPWTILLLGAALALGIFGYVTAGSNKHLAVLFAGGPFFVAGLLFALYVYLTRRAWGL
ncbi:MAG: hypothetical protein JXA37_13355 [Chloroflexia bacterium]|nr:hypothetical protein [Chloroflexia bacterium]